GAVGPADISRASGVSNTMQRFGSAFGIAIVTAVFTAAHGHLGSAASVTVGYRPALAVSAALSLAGAVVAMAAGGRRGHHPPQVDTGRPAVPASAGVPDSATVPAATLVNSVTADGAAADAPL
ncbi:MAG: transporter, partial [Actinomycetia bacterium]|nr:transporter [Actinomycetes bacterium]